MTLLTPSIRPSNSHGESLKPQSLFSISTFLFKTIIWLPCSVHCKLTDSHSYLLYSSSHPAKTQFRTSNFSRGRRLCSDDSDFKVLQINEISNFFSERGCPDYIVYKTLNRIQNVNRESSLKPSVSNNEEPIPFTLTLQSSNLAAIFFKN